MDETTISIVRGLRASCTSSSCKGGAWCVWRTYICLKGKSRSNRKNLHTSSSRKVRFLFAESIIQAIGGFPKFITELQRAAVLTSADIGHLYAHDAWSCEAVRSAVDSGVASGTELATQFSCVVAFYITTDRMRFAGFWRPWNFRVFPAHFRMLWK